MNKAPKGWPMTDDGTLQCVTKTPGRPNKPADQKAESDLHIRVPTSEKASWVKAATRSKTKLSVWVRRVLNEAAFKQ